MSDLLINVEFWKAIAQFSWPITVVILALIFRKFLITLTKKDQMTIKVAGMEISVAQATKQTGVELSDIQSRLAALEEVKKEQGENGELPPETATLPNYTSLLWVDDYPSNNAFLIEKLERDGVHIRKELSTDSALAALKSDSFDLVISDLGRVENGVDNPLAGLDFVRETKAAGLNLPILIFAGTRGIQNRDRLLTAGATEVTSSSVDVFRFINQHTGSNV